VTALQEPWFAAHDRANAAAPERNSFGPPIEGMPEDLWDALCIVIEASAWPAGQVLAPRTVSSIAGGVSQLLIGALKTSPALVPETRKPGVGAEVLPPGDLSIHP
jgi:hypothetical protein